MPFLLVDDSVPLSSRCLLRKDSPAVKELRQASMIRQHVAMSFDRELLESSWCT